MNAQGYAFGFTITGQDWRDRSAVESLEDAAALRAGVDALIAARVERCRREGLSWAQIGNALGISKQAAQQRYGS